MRRQDTQLLAQARQGDARARCEVGRRYLQGADSFPRHLPSGIEHLRQAAQTDAASAAAAAAIMAECLPLHEFVELAQLDVLALAASQDVPAAQLMLGTWRHLQADGAADGQRWLAAAAQAGQADAQRALDAIHAAAADGADAASGAPTLALLRVLDGHAGIDSRAVLRLAIQDAQQQGALAPLVNGLSAALVLDGGLTPELVAPIVAAVKLAQAQGGADDAHGGAQGDHLAAIEPQALRDALEQHAVQGDHDIAFIVGRALCDIAVPGLPANVYGGQQNMRKGAAFLLRAADAGCDEAWLHLYRLHADHHLSVANPPMARFFLEKAAMKGQVQAQRILGALQLRTAASIAESEQAIAWLHSAASHDDSHARILLQSLVLAVPGNAAEAAWAVQQVREADPWLAARLELARAFGLSKLEALSVDPADGLRPWGLVVGRNPFIVQARLSAPRAIPALTAEALQLAQRAAALFAQARGANAEGDLRNRSLRQRRLFDKLNLDEALFFADVSSTALETLRSGAKWAHRERQPLQDALAAA